jgi:hypothetical protein
MKIAAVLVERDDIHDYMMGLWQSDVFRASHLAGTFVHEQVERFAWLPRVFATTTNDYLERSHFCTWWNVVMLRDGYTNPIIHDLYYLHEMAHAATMPYLRDISMTAWSEKMQRNELEASVLSEIAVYFEMPGLRECSFPHPIYADRFLLDPDMRDLWSANPAAAIDTLRTMRREVMTGRNDLLLDDAERWIRRFADQNAAWAVSWSHRYLDVENFMAAFRPLAARNRAEAAAQHVAWIGAEAARDPVDLIPFRDEAELFSPFYWTNKRRYEAAMQER